MLRGLSSLVESSSIIFEGTVTRVLPPVEIGPPPGEEAEDEEYSCKWVSIGKVVKVDKYLKKPLNWEKDEVVVREVGSEKKIDSKVEIIEHGISPLKVGDKVILFLPLWNESTILQKYYIKRDRVFHEDFPGMSMSLSKFEAEVEKEIKKFEEIWMEKWKRKMKTYFP
ncbi:MAG: hypothetical protein AB1466_04145 [Actinomycetota bacterium]